MEFNKEILLRELNNRSHLFSKSTYEYLKSLINLEIPYINTRYSYVDLQFLLDSTLIRNIAKYNTYMLLSQTYSSNHDYYVSNLSEGYKGIFVKYKDKEILSFSYGNPDYEWKIEEGKDVGNIKINFMESDLHERLKYIEKLKERNLSIDKEVILGLELRTMTPSIEEYIKVSKEVDNTFMETFNLNNSDFEVNSSGLIRYYRLAYPGLKLERKLTYY